MPYGAQSAFANVATATTDAAVIAAVAGKQINVLAVAIVDSTAAASVTFNSKPGGAGTAISALFAVGINGVMALPEQPKGWFITNSGEGLTVTTTGTTPVGIQVVYELL